MGDDFIFLALSSTQQLHHKWANMEEKCFQWKQEIQLIRLMEHMVHFMLRYYQAEVFACTHTHTRKAQKLITEIELRWWHYPFLILSKCRPFSFCPQTQKCSPWRGLFHVLLFCWHSTSFCPCYGNISQKGAGVCGGLNWAELLRSLQFQVLPHFCSVWGIFTLLLKTKKSQSSCCILRLSFSLNNITCDMFDKDKIKYDNIFFHISWYWDYILGITHIFNKLTVQNSSKY